MPVGDRNIPCRSTQEDAVVFVPGRLDGRFASPRPADASDREVVAETHCDRQGPAGLRNESGIDKHQTAGPANGQP